MTVLARASAVVRSLDGNHLGGTAHRLVELRTMRAAALPGQTLVVRDPELGLVTEGGGVRRRPRPGEVSAGLEAPTLWKRYLPLTEAEWAFRITQDERVIRPIWHQKPERVKAPILVRLLAYVLWNPLGQWRQRSGLGAAPRTVLLESAKIKSGAVVLPVRRPAHMQLP